MDLSKLTKKELIEKIKELNTSRHYLNAQKDALRASLDRLDAITYDKLSDVPSVVLLACALNAHATTSCGGHLKGEMNESRAMSYEQELNRRGIEIKYDTSERFEIGQYNGHGSF